MPEKVLYTAEAISIGDGRNGHVTSADGRSTSTSPSTEMGGSGDGANPEELFAAGYAACYHSALRAIARRTGVDVDAPPSGRTSASAPKVTPSTSWPRWRSTCRTLARAGPRGRRRGPPGLPVLAGDARQHQRRAAAHWPGATTEQPA